MKKKNKFPVKSLCFFGICLLISLYYVTGIYYRQSFGMGKFINGVYCTGKSVEEINSELTGEYNGRSFTVTDLYGNSYEIPLSSVNYKVDYISQLKIVQSSQSVFLWGIEAITGGNKKISPEISFSEEALLKALEKNGFFANNRKEPVLEIRKERAYVLYDGRKNALQEEKMRQVLTDSLLAGNLSIDVSECYEDLPYTSEMEKTLMVWKTVETFQNRSLIYDMGDGDVVLTPEITAEFLICNGGKFTMENGWPVVNEEGITAFVDNLAAEYDTYGKPHFFHATRGEDIEIEGGTYGNELDREAEIAFLKDYFGSADIQTSSGEENFADGNLQPGQDALQNGKHIPSYKKQAYVRGKKDLLTTYVEVDMGEQKLYYYEDGVLKLETDVVTGNMSRKWDTPAGVNYVYGKQKNRTLRGPGYATPVNYWMPVNGNIGLHDATWRREFGGEIYLKSGSHGCINIPKDKAGELYDMVVIGTPVVMFY